MVHCRCVSPAKQSSLHGGVRKWGVSSDYAEVPVSSVKWVGLR